MRPRTPATSMPPMKTDAAAHAAALDDTGETAMKNKIVSLRGLRPRSAYDVLAVIAAVAALGTGTATRAAS